MNVVVEINADENDCSYYMCNDRNEVWLKSYELFCVLILNWWLCFLGRVRFRQPDLLKHQLTLYTTDYTITDDNQ